MPVRLSNKVRPATNRVTESAQELDKQGHRIGFTVRLDCMNDFPREAVECLVCRGIRTLGKVYLNLPSIGLYPDPQPVTHAGENLFPDKRSQSDPSRRLAIVRKAPCCGAHVNHASFPFLIPRSLCDGGDELGCLFFIPT